MNLDFCEGTESRVDEKTGNIEIISSDSDEVLWTYISKEQGEMFLEKSTKMVGIKGQVGQLYQLPEDQTIWGGRSVVMKCMKKSKWWLEWFDKLAAKLKKNLNNALFKKCEHLVDILGVCDTVPNLLLIFMEKCDASVKDGIGPNSTFTKKQRIQILMETSLGIDYLHSKEIVHCDLKWSNILLHNGHVKVADFDQTKSSKSPPEAQSGVDFDPKKSNLIFYDKPSTDLRAFGIMIKCLLFNNRNQHRIKMEEEKEKFGVSESMISLIKDCSAGTIPMNQVCKVLGEEFEHLQ